MKLSWSNKYKEKFQQAVLMFDSGKSTSEISRDLHIDKSTLRKNLRLFGKEVKNSNCDDTIYSDIFDTIDTEEKAYWLGFLYADGYVGKDSNRFSLTIKDKEHIEKFQKFIGSKRMRIKNINGRQYYDFTMRNKNIHDSLIKNGCVPKKSLVLEFPSENIVPKHLINPFVRGYFDGDGHVSKSIHGILITILGTKNFLEKIKIIYGFPENKYNMAGLAYEYRIANSFFVKYFLDSIYKNSNIYLDRKYNFYSNCRFKQ